MLHFIKTSLFNPKSGTYLLYMSKPIDLDVKHLAASPKLTSEYDEPTALHKNYETLLSFRIVSIHRKWNGTKLLSSETEYTSCHMSYRTTYDSEI